jgi:subtilase family serine protease
MKRSITHSLVASCSAVALAAVAFIAPVTTAATAAGNGGVVPQIIVGRTFPGQTPPTSAQCISAIGIACYMPSDLQAQYDFTTAYNKGYNGAGQTIVIFDSFGSPTITSDLATFDSTFGIPAPPSFTIDQPEGHVSYNYLHASAAAVNANKNMQTEIGWADETTLDVEWSHAMAPGANIVLVETPNAETEGVQGLENLQNAQQWALKNNIGTIWSNSWAATEQSFHNTSVVNGLDAFYAKAAAAGVSTFFATGDSGVSNADKQGATYPGATVNYPASSPNVIAVGGTEIPTPVDSISSYQPEQPWNDGYGAGGGGFSSIFSEPSYQSSAGITDPSGTRGMPDVSYNAAIISAILVYGTYDPTPANDGWQLIGGTSAAAPQWAAIDAIANQADGSLGFLTPRLYQVYTGPDYASAFHDITTGTNGTGGYSAGPGWDPASGLGTPDVGNLITALASTTGP